MLLLQSLTGKMKEHTFIQRYSPAVNTASTSVIALGNNLLAYSNWFFVIIYGWAEKMRFASLIHIQETQFKKKGSAQYCQFLNKNVKKIKEHVYQHKACLTATEGRFQYLL
jgi:hypothetical protein